MENPKPKPGKNILQKDIGSEIIPAFLGGIEESIRSLREWFSKKNLPISREQAQSIAQKIKSIKDYKPLVAILGKTGSGKSELCNAIFGERLADVSETEACTRKQKNYELQFPDITIILTDVPGVGESEAKDQEYSELYASLLPEVDLLLWVVKGDDRALTIDLHFWKTSVRNFIASEKPAFIVLNQVDKFNPLKEWDSKNNLPGPTQQKSIEKKIVSLSDTFGLQPKWIVAVSAFESYNISRLVEAITPRSIAGNVPNRSRTTTSPKRSNGAKAEAEYCGRSWRCTFVKMKVWTAEAASF